VLRYAEQQPGPRKRLRVTSCKEGVRGNKVKIDVPLWVAVGATEVVAEVVVAEVVAAVAEETFTDDL